MKTEKKDVGTAINSLTNILFWGGIIIVAYILFTYISTLSLFSTTGGGNTYTTLEGETILKTNLGLLFLPYIAGSTFQNDCYMASGSFIQTPDKVGCFNTALNLPVGDICVGNVPLSLKTQCEATGATWICNTHNVGCLYN